MYVQKQCKHINSKSGEQCNAFALQSGYCFSHDPESKNDKARAVFKGGIARKKIKLGLSPVKIKTTDDVVNVLEEIINLVRGGDLPCSNPANTIGFLCSHILKAIELNKLERKVDIIEEILSERKNI